ncbi:hypothetical protein GG344DRAFT_62878 [Lentinula edodes]|nr:hypothetical protein GG344DRAFT_62878 [Lentinula edodes]
MEVDSFGGGFFDILVLSHILRRLGPRKMYNSMASDSMALIIIMHTQCTARHPRRHQRFSTNGFLKNALFSTFSFSLGTRLLRGYLVEVVMLGITLVGVVFVVEVTEDVEITLMTIGAAEFRLATRNPYKTSRGRELIHGRRIRCSRDHSAWDWIGRRQLRRVGLVAVVMDVCKRIPLYAHDHARRPRIEQDHRSQTCKAWISYLNNSPQMQRVDHKVGLGSKAEYYTFQTQICVHKSSYATRLSVSTPLLPRVRTLSAACQRLIPVLFNDLHHFGLALELERATSI